MHGKVVPILFYTLIIALLKKITVALTIDYLYDILKFDILML